MSELTSISIRPDLRQWYCIWSHPKYEFIAERQLIARGFPTFLPSIRKKGKEILQPIFPRYFFVQFDETLDYWKSIYSVIGVRTLLSADESPIPIADPVIDRIRTTLLELTSPADRVVYHKGSQVEIMSGIYQGKRGICEWSSNRRIGLLMDLLSTTVKVTIDRDNVTLV